MRGHIERVHRLGVSGWAWAAAGPVRLEVLVDGVPVDEIVADRPRADLDAAGLGACAFEAWFPAAKAPGATVALRTRDGDVLPSGLAGVPAPPAPAAQRPDFGAPLALFLDAATPDAARDAGSAAALSHMASLRRLGFEVAFAAEADAAAVLRSTAGRVRLAYLHRLPVMARWVGTVRALNPGVRVMFALADLASLREAREAVVHRRRISGHLAAAELAACRMADAVLTHSTVEAGLLARSAALPPVYVVPWEVPARPATVPVGCRRGMGFIASYGHAPNRDAAEVLLRQVMPLVRGVDPTIPCVLAGSGMPDGLRAEALSRGAVVLGQVEDAGAFFSQVRVSVAPLRFGAGVKGKVLDSLAAGVPCVMSRIAAEAMPLPRTLRRYVRADPAGLAAGVLRLHANAAEAAALARAGLAWVARRHAAHIVDRALRRAAIPEAGQARRGPPASRQESGG
jgi:hypothetical protein